MKRRPELIVEFRWRDPDSGRWQVRGVMVVGDDLKCVAGSGFDHTMGETGKRFGDVMETELFRAAHAAVGYPSAST